MREPTWWERILCGRFLIGDCEAEKEKLRVKIEELELLLHDCHQAHDDCEVENQKLNDDITYLEERIKKLLDSQADGIIIPDISDYLALKTVLRPYENTQLAKYDLLCADLEYYALPKAEWIQALTPIQEEVDKVLKGWKTSISDCDDYALVMNAFLAIAFVEADLDKQGVFAVTWSRTHAYNTYTDSDGVTWVYEPQNNKTIGILGETEKPYDTRMIWFPHEPRGGE